jgi:WD40 repeat protein/mono/diheme cytochrome c family protein
MTPVRVFALFSLLLLSVAVRAAEPGKEAPIPDVVSYYRDVRPVFQQHCQGCHQPAKAQGDFVMTAHAGLLLAGESGKAAIVAGKVDASNLIEQIVPKAGKKPAMPKNKEPLPQREVTLIKKWIAQGATDDTPSTSRQVIDQEHPPTYVLPPVITSIAYAPDGKLLAVAGYHEILLHHADGSGLAGRLIGISERIQSLAFSPDGKLLAASGGDPGRFGEVQIWDVAKKKLKLSHPVTFDTVYGVSWSPDATRVAFGCADNTLRAIDIATGQQVLYQGAANDWVLDTVWSVDGSYLVSVSRDRAMRLVEVATQRFIDNITSITPGALKGGLMAVDRNPKKDELLCAGADGTPKIFQMHRNKKRVIGDDFNLIKSFAPLPGRIYAAKYSIDGSLIAVGSSLDGVGEVRVYRAATKPGEKNLATASLLTYSSRGFATLPLMLEARLDGRLVATMENVNGPVYTLAYRPDGKQLASAGFDGMVRLHDPLTGKLSKEFAVVPGKPIAATTK